MNLPVTLIHGWGMNSSCWDELVGSHGDSQFEPLDLPGHGKRFDELLPDSLDSVAKDMLAQAPEESLWCGWSLGALVALRAAAMAPERIRALVLVAPTPCFVQKADWTHGMPQNVFQEFYNSVQTNAVTSLKRFSLLMFEGCDNARQHGREFFDRLREHGLPSTDNLLTGLDLLNQTDLRTQLVALEQPVYLLSGTRDNICPISASRWLHQECGWPLAETQDGHAPQIAHADLLARTIAIAEQELSLV